LVGGSRGQTASQSNGKGIIDSIPLGSKLSALLAHLSVSDICAEDGHKVILQIIEDAHEYLKDQRLEQAFDEAIFRIFRGRRERGQTMTAFLTAKKAAFAELKKQGLDLLDGRAGRHLLGHLILRQGAFTLDQRQRLKVVTNGSIDYKEIEIALQKICGDRLDDGGGSYDQQPGPRRWRSSTFWDGDGYGDEWVGEYAETYATAEGYDMDYAADDNWMGDLVCLNDDASEVQMVFPRELPMVMEEEVSTLPKSAWTKAKAKERKAKGRVLQRRLVSCLHTPVLGEVVKVDILNTDVFCKLHGIAVETIVHGVIAKVANTRSLAENESKSRCHACKQIGHWSKQCPLRSRSTSNGNAKGASPSTSHSSMSTGFFLTPPKQMADQFMQQPFAGLSFCFMSGNRSLGTALVDTAAQHGLVGMQTIEVYT
jgi:hypothetical protein